RHDFIASRRKWPPQFFRQIGSVQHSGRNLEQPDRLVGAADREAAAGKIDSFGLRLQKQRSDARATVNNLLGRLPHDKACEPHAATRMGSAAEFHDIGIMGDDAYVLDRDVVPLVDKLRETGLVSLSLRCRTNDDVDPTVRSHGYLGALSRNPG